MSVLLPVKFSLRYGNWYFPERSLLVFVLFVLASVGLHTVLLLLVTLRLYAHLHLFCGRLLIPYLSRCTCTCTGAATYWFRTGNTWLTVLLTLNRYMRVCQPLEFNRFCTVRRTYVVSTLAAP